MISIKVPPLGESIVEATVARWLKGEGEMVAQGDTLVELETDKITVEVPAPSAGKLVRQAHKDGDVVHPGEELAAFDEAAEGAAVAAAPSKPAAAAATSASVAAASPAASAPPAVATTATPAPRATPSARRVAAELDLDLASVAGSGPSGRITKGDALAAAAVREAQPGAPAPVARSAPPAPAAPSPSTTPSIARPPQVPQRTENGRETREKMSTRRRRIAEHLVEAQHVTAHLTTFNEVDMSAVSALRDRLRERVEKEHGVKLTFMPFFARAAILALQAYPVVNAQVEGDTIVYRHYVNLGVAVASDQGLVVPVIKDTDRMGMIEFGRELSAIAARARDGKLTLDDLTGGTFTITNGGVFGSLVSTPILNYPQVGILGLHKIQERPVALGGQVVIRPMMYVALSYDHRIVDGQQAVLFLVRLKELMEDPAAMLVV